MTADVLAGVSFRPDLIETIDEAFERAQVDPASITSRHLQSARRSLNYILIRISMRYPQLWLVEDLTFTLEAGQKTVEFSEGVIDVISIVSRDANGYDTPMGFMGREDYLNIPDKDQQGSRPDRIWVDRSSVDAPVGHLWQVPATAGQSIVVNVMKYAATASSFDKHPEVPLAWQDALADMLSVKLAQKYNDKALPICLASEKRSEREARMATSERSKTVMGISRPRVRGRRG